MMDVNVASVPAAVVRCMPSNAVFGASTPAVTCRNNAKTRDVSGAASLHGRTSNVDVSTTTTTTTGLAWQHQTAVTTTYDNSKTLTTTTTTSTTKSGPELDCAADQRFRSDGANGDAWRQTCAACGRDIVDRFLLHAIDRYWHTGCLRCSACHAPLADLGATCFTRAGMTLCRDDYIRLFGLSGTCRACHHQIPPNEFVMKTPDGAAVYHVTCFACVTCHGRLATGDRYGIVNGNLVCETDYIRAALSNHQRPQQPTSVAASSAPPSRQHHGKVQNTVMN